MDNTVGRTDTTFCDLQDVKNAYAFGLWCADGYHRTSSIGLTNVDERLINSFREFLMRYFANDRIKTRIYSRDIGIGHYYLEKATRPAYQIYVNSRPLLKYFRNARKEPKRFLANESMRAYFAGRFDGDGSVASDSRSDLRIVYGDREEADRDADLLHGIGIANKVYEYRKARTFAMYISRFDAEKFLSSIAKYSLRRRK